MFRNKHLANSLSDAAMGEILAMIKYKSGWYNTICQPIDMWTPSSKKCHCCGYIKKDLKLSDREWTCPVCGTHHHRDKNASINIEQYALEIYIQEHGDQEWLSIHRYSVPILDTI
jgi:putative transposase